MKKANFVEGLQWEIHCMCENEQNVKFKNVLPLVKNVFRNF